MTISGTSHPHQPVGPQTTDRATDQGKQVAHEAKESGEQVAQTAQEEVRNVASTVSEQARHLLHETTSEINSQAATQQQRLAEGLRSLSQELSSMADGGTDSSSQASGLVREASQRTQGLADWLEQRGPGDVLDDVRRFARRRPGTFIAVAAGVGLLAGRLTRGLTADDEADQRSGYAGVVEPTPGPYAAQPATVGGPAGVGSPTPAPPVGAGPVDPGPMSGIGAGPVGGIAPSAPGSGRAAPPDRDPDEFPVYGDDPR
ncbi:hypothetical protein [Ornithinimicrobium cavernae]|uniref:hypothetical protein n=1 Tax=Ornithinimicrobium cavernae TaxID=2666047 RepID=UPI000D69FC79|nr:hypothetical protein [Ornithinimicrobium cavernae]